jgi:hypothetical protein
MYARRVAIVASVGLSILAVAIPARAQRTRASADSDSGAMRQFAQAIADAEAEGARHPRTANDETSRRCAVVQSQVMQSGNFESRGWANYATRGYGKLTWWPAYAHAGDTLTVRVISATGRSDTTLFRFGGPVRNYGTGNMMYPSAVRPPPPGAWLFLATAGPNWGCFLYAPSP